VDQNVLSQIQPGICKKEKGDVFRHLFKNSTQGDFRPKNVDTLLSGALTGGPGLLIYDFTC
jgi:hypothetical protein